MRSLWIEMRYGATLGDRRYRAATTIAERSGYSLKHVQNELKRMEKRGEVECKRGGGFAHGNRKLWRLRR